MAFTYEWRGDFHNADLNALHAEGFGHPLLEDDDWKTQVEQHSLGWVCAREADGLVGFVNVAWDGASHAFVLDTLIAARFGGWVSAPNWLRSPCPRLAPPDASGCTLTSKDHLRTFYFEACGFEPTNAGLIAL